MVGPLANKTNGAELILNLLPLLGGVHSLCRFVDPCVQLRVSPANSHKTPVLIFSFVVVATKVNITLPDSVQNQSLSDKLMRIDYLGSLTLVGAVGCLLLGFSLKSTEEMEWTHPLIVGLLSASVVFTGLFVWVEKFWAPFPVMPLRLVTQRTPLAVSISNLLTSMSAFSMVRGLHP